MKQWILFLLISTIFIGMLNGCGPSEEEQRRAEEARQDSLEEVRQQQLEQQRKDSIAQARKDSLAAEKKKEEEEEESQIDVTFDESGAYAVQVEAWRSQRKAENQVDKWVNRGFGNSFVVQHGEEGTGDIWFRVRLGRLSSQEAAQNLQEQLRDKYDAPSWISTSDSN